MTKTILRENKIIKIKTLPTYTNAINIRAMSPSGYYYKNLRFKDSKIQHLFERIMESIVDMYVCLDDVCNKNEHATIYKHETICETIKNIIEDFKAENVVSEF